MYTDRDSAAEKSLTTAKSGWADISSTARSYDQLLSAGTLLAYDTVS